MPATQLGQPAENANRAECTARIVSSRCAICAHFRKWCFAAVQLLPDCHATGAPVPRSIQGGPLRTHICFVAPRGARRILSPRAASPRLFVIFLIFISSLPYPLYFFTSTGICYVCINCFHHSVISAFPIVEKLRPCLLRYWFAFILDLWIATKRIFAPIVEPLNIWLAGQLAHTIWVMSFIYTHLSKLITALDFTILPNSRF